MEFVLKCNWWAVFLSFRCTCTSSQGHCFDFLVVAQLCNVHITCVSLPWSAKWCFALSIVSTIWTSKLPFNGYSLLFSLPVSTSRWATGHHRQWGPACSDDPNWPLHLYCKPQAANDCIRVMVRERTPHHTPTGCPRARHIARKGTPEPCK